MKRTSAAISKYRKDARGALFHASNWICALTVTFSVLLIIFSAIFLSVKALVLLSEIYPDRIAVRLLVHSACFLLLSPLLIGLLYYYTDLFRFAHGDGPSHVPPTVIFSPYASVSSAARAWWQTAVGLILFALVPLSFAPMYFSGRLLSENRFMPWGVLILFGCIILFLTVLYLNARLLPAAFLSAVHPEYAFGTVLRRTWDCTRSASLTGVLLQLELLAASLLSMFLTVGIVYFIYVLPIAVFSYIGYCHDIALHSEMF